MIATPNMSLVAWDQPSDDFTHAQLVANWQAIDQHDHSLGRGVQINTTGIATNAVTSAKITDRAITNSKLGTGAVTTDIIQAEAVTHAQLAAESVYGEIIPSGAITAPMLDPQIFPLGIVTQWYRGPTQTHLPGGGWEIMDGRLWSAIPNDLGLTTGRIPDMRRMFPRGADLFDSLYAIGLGGGYEIIDLRHRHYVNPHHHTLRPHFHPIGIDGKHAHRWFGGFNVWTRRNAFFGPITVTDVLGQYYYNEAYTLYVKSMQASPFFPDNDDDFAMDMDHNGDHDHGGGTKFDPGGRSDDGDGDTDDQLGEHPLLPTHIHLLYIMRVRNE